MSYELAVSALRTAAKTIPDPRCPFVLLIDTSDSMSGQPIEQVNQGLRTFQSELQKDIIARRRIEITLATFDSEVDVVLDWVSAGSFQAPTLGTRPQTNMGEAIISGVEMIRERKRAYIAASLKCNRPFIVLITDGEPTEQPERWPEGARLVREEMAAPGGLSFIAIAVGNANTRILKSITNDVYALEGYDFRSLFKFVTVTLSSGARGNPGTGMIPFFSKGGAISRL